MTTMESLTQISTLSLTTHDNSDISVALLTEKRAKEEDLME